MNPSRREFVILSSAIVAGCGGREPENAQRLVAPLDAGPEADYSAPGLYTGLRYKGVFLVRRGGELLALSSVCTHRACRLKPKSDGSFRCPCHGSTFDRNGHVTKGPATRDLPQYHVALDQRRHVIVSPASNES
jgi:Rieske Fe-S protein